MKELFIRNKIVFQTIAALVLLAIFMAKSFLLITDASAIYLDETERTVDIYELKISADGTSKTLKSSHDKKWLMAVFVFGTEGDDVISARGLKQIKTFIFAKAGDDQVSGGAANDWIMGGDGADTIVGFSGVDRLFGGKGRDQVFGGEGEDKIYGPLAEDFSFEDDDIDFLT